MFSLWFTLLHLKMCFVILSDSRQKDGSTWYLCKWRDLPYDQATWESEDADIADMKQHIENYENLRFVTDGFTTSFYFQI